MKKKEQLEKEIKSLIREWAGLQEKPNKIRYSGPCFGAEEYQAAVEALMSGWWSNGFYTLRCEEELAKLNGKKHALLVNSGSSSNLLLIAAAKELYFKDGDKKAANLIQMTVKDFFELDVTPLLQYNGEMLWKNLENL